MIVWDADNKLVLAIIAGSSAIVGTLITAIVAFRNGTASTNVALELNTRSVREGRFKPFYETQLKLSLEATRAAATLAMTVDRVAFAAARARFLELYAGELAVVEQATSEHGIASVEAKMVEFRRVLDAAGSDALPRGDLEGPSLELAQAVRRQTSSSWDVTLGPLGHTDIDPAPRRSAPPKQASHSTS